MRTSVVTHLSHRYVSEAVHQDCGKTPHVSGQVRAEVEVLVVSVVVEQVPGNVVRQGGYELT